MHPRSSCTTAQQIRPGIVSYQALRCVSCVQCVQIFLLTIEIEVQHHWKLHRLLLLLLLLLLMHHRP
jgi:hypothetical protein